MTWMPPALYASQITNCISRYYIAINYKYRSEMETRGSPEPVSFFWLFQHCLSSSKFVITEKKLFIHILIAKQRTVVSVNLGF